MGSRIGARCAVYTSASEVDDWVRGEIPPLLRERLMELKMEMGDLDEVYKRGELGPLTKTWAALQVFTAEKLSTLQVVNDYISKLQRPFFEEAWAEAMDCALEIALHRLGQVFPDRDCCREIEFLYQRKRADIFQIMHRLVSPQFVGQIFNRWRVLDVKLDKRENRWCFVLTSPFKYVCYVLEDFTEQRPHELERCLEHAFRVLLGECSSSVLHRPSSYGRSFGWFVQETNEIKFVHHHDMETMFKSCRDI